MNEEIVQIQLTFVGTVVAEIRSDALTQSILIGRDPTAVWQPPTGDRTMPAKAAVLQLHDGRPRLKAEKGAAFRLNGVVTRERLLQSGDRIALGDCELFVKAARVSRCYVPYHRLEPLVGERHGVFVDVKDETFVVGSGEGVGLRLEDDTVSRRHATLSLRGDECWVHDESSRNGTFVNGQRLGGKERLLRDGDILGFGPFEYRFLDRAVLHVRTSPVRNLLIVLATLLIAAGGWWMFYRRTPDAAQYLLAAKQFAYAERFGDAERMLQKAGRARQAEENGQLLRRQKKDVAVWQMTADVWKDFRDNLSQRRFSAAVDQIGQLALDDPDNWCWNEDTLDARLAEAREAVALLQLATSFWQARVDSELPDDVRAMLATERRKRQVDHPDFTQDKREWMRSLKQYLHTCVVGFDENEALFTSLTNKTAQLARTAGRSGTEPKAVRDFAAEIADKAFGHVRAAAYLLLEPLDKLEADRRVLERDARALAEFNSIGYSGRLLVTTPDDCMVSPDLMRCHEQNVKRRRELDLASLEIRAMLKRLLRYGVSLKAPPPSLACFEDTNRVERAFRCELLDARRPPRVDRTKPVDDAYDRLFGYEYLYSYIEEGYYAYPDEVNPERLNHAGFQPEMITLNNLNEEILADLKTLEGKEFDGIRTGTFAARIDLLKDWARRIRAVRDYFDDIADDPKEMTTRRGILARGVALYLTPHAEITKPNWDDFRRRVVWQRENVRARVSEIDPVKPEKTREVVDWIMSRGVPGSPAVKKAWGDR